MYQDIRYFCSLACATRASKPVVKSINDISSKHDEYSQWKL